MKEPVDKGILDKFLLEMSIYQDQLLQNYRLIFISSQTILISIAMLLLISGNEPIPSLLSYIILLCIGVILLTIWRAVTENRELDVSYCHMQLLKSERDKDEKDKNKKLSDDERERPFDSFKNWQQYNMDAKIAKLNNYDKHLLESSVRKKLKNLPYWFLVFWISGFAIWIIITFDLFDFFKNFIRKFDF